MRPEGPRQNRLTPFKVLAVLLYGELDCFYRSSPSRLIITLGPFARFLGIQNYRLRDYLKWLEGTGYLKSTTLTYNKAVLELELPPHVRKVLDEKAS